MKIENVYLTGVHRYSFRAGEPGKIVGVKVVTPTGKDKPISPRIAYHIQYEDGFEDYVAISDVGNYAISTLSELLEQGVPQIFK